MACALVFVLSGCGSSSAPKPLERDAFYRANDDPLVASGDYRREPETHNSVGVSVEQGPRVPTAAVRDTSPPTTRPIGEKSGQYMTIGAVLTEVNGTPIYADKVVSLLNTQLGVEAKQRDLDAFKRYARNEIMMQVKNMVNDELQYAQAQRVSTAQERDLADRLTMQWRQQQITQNGGSLEQTRAKFAAEGLDFDDVLRDKMREFVVKIWINKKILPQVQVTAQDMREFYDRNKDKLFTEADVVTFRLLKIDVSKVGTRDEALIKARALRDRAAAGEDFVAICTQFNHDTRLAKTGGLESPISKGNYANTKVEDELWKTQTGQLTEVIDTGTALYVARVEERKVGFVRPFEDPQVQIAIQDTLRAQQMRPLLDRAQEALVASAIINPNPPLIEPALEIAIQKYPAWRAGAEASINGSTR